ncbi:DUF262 domain-containing protein [Maritimibacter sp. UBA3975]|uniref:DUF262 domain-containing protein n=1 Tax=Maritimibacter sp. UBA3975 TaxID=1946833 RepID=UPI000C090D08|nr:DUF262 domain-containing protein [Maritimibacter sp. UBA3975]MAM61434.1 hypothetical protein [Maritimibacter sp.]|tara:strand:+ start:18667 stop:19893 length:1227 start_codon:yes stop_codon:yes gene_type:complete
MAEIEGLQDDDEPLDVGNMVIPAGASDKEIEKHFEIGRLRVVQEKNDIFLSHVLDFIQGTSESRVWTNLRPEYQRRLRWDNKKKSKLIESFIMNIPVPPIFLYEKTLGKFEVMDGQQRLNAISEFWAGSFELEGLKIWAALNGRTYAQLPPLVRRGLERAKISAITLMSDTSGGEDNSIELRAQVFERLNTGGEQLNAQELRNSLYSGPFNDMIITLSKEKSFTDSWGIPDHEENTLADGSVAEALKKNVLYKRMTDVEIVLRFFAFQQDDRISGSVRSMLDAAMKSNRNMKEEQIEISKGQFLDTLSLASEVFGDDAFRLPGVGDGKGKLSKPLYDAQIIALFRLFDRAEDIRASAPAIKEAVMNLAQPDRETYELMVGRGNTAATIKERIAAVIAAIQGVIGNGAA